MMLHRKVFFSEEGTVTDVLLLPLCRVFEFQACVP